MLKLCGDLDLAREPLGPQGGRQLGAEHLERHLALVLHVVRQVHRRHPARSKLALDGVTIGQCGLQAIRPIVHGRDRVFSRLRRDIADTCGLRHVE
jgi:hypothetical protein